MILKKKNWISTKILSPKIIDFYQIFCQNTGMSATKKLKILKFLKNRLKKSEKHKNFISPNHSTAQIGPSEKPAAACMCAKK